MATKQAENKELVRQDVEEVFNEGNLESIDEHFAEDYVGHQSSGDIHGPEELKEYVRAPRSGFPDLEVTIEHPIAEGDKVCRWSRITGTHEGQFMGIEPTGETVDVPGAAIYRIQDRQIVESWGLLDMMGLMQHLCIAEPPG